MGRRKTRVIVIGMGKPGFIAQKISASMASTGTPSFWLHPTDAMHGDIGRVTRNDVALILSKSGQTDEIQMLTPVLREIGCKIIAITANPRSALAEASD